MMVNPNRFPFVQDEPRRLPHSWEKIRSVRLTPYGKGMGPRFSLTVWDTNTTGMGQKSRLAYRLTMSEGKDRTAIFQGSDFYCSPMHAVDSDESVRSLLGFLTLRPGDTDPEYFAEYTEVQRDYAATHAETLAREVHFRFGDG